MIRRQGLLMMTFATTPYLLEIAIIHKKSALFKITHGAELEPTPTESKCGPLRGFFSHDDHTHVQLGKPTLLFKANGFHSAFLLCIINFFDGTRVDRLTCFS